MDIIKEMKSQLVNAVKQNKEVEKNVLRFALSEIAALENQAAQGGKPLTDGQIQKILKNIIDGNSDCASFCKDSEVDQQRKQKLTLENNILEKYIPKMLTQPEITEKLANHHEAILAAKSTGMGTGVAMKLFKEWKDSVDGKDVTAVVEKICSGA